MCSGDHTGRLIMNDSTVLGRAANAATEHALKQSEARLRQVVESAPNAMVMINGRGEIEMVNAQAERVFGYDASRDARQIHRHAGAGALSTAATPALRSIVFHESRVASHGCRPRPLRPEEGRHRVPDRDRPQSDRDRGRHDGALGDRRHLLAQTPGRALSAGRGIRAECDGHDQPRRQD